MGSTQHVTWTDVKAKQKSKCEHYLSHKNEQILTNIDINFGEFYRKLNILEIHFINFQNFTNYNEAKNGKISQVRITTCYKDLIKLSTFSLIFYLNLNSSKVWEFYTPVGDTSIYRQLLLSCIHV